MLVGLGMFFSFPYLANVCTLLYVECGPEATFKTVKIRSSKYFRPRQ